MLGVIRIAPIGLTEQESTVLSVTANLLSAFDMLVEVVRDGDGGGDGDGHIAIVDLDSEAGKSYLRGGSSKQAKLIFSECSGSTAGIEHLQKPIRVHALKEALLDLAKRLDSAVHGSPVQGTERKSQAAAGPLPESLYYAVTKAVIEGELVCIKSPSGAVLHIHGPGRQIYTSVDGNALDEMAKLDKASFRVDVLTEAEFIPGTIGKPARNLNELIWRAAYFGGRGILMPQHSPHVPVKLVAWPKFTKGYVKPGYLKLAATMAKKPLTLAEAIQFTGISEAVANDFYNAVYALGLIETGHRSQVGTIKKATGYNGLFAKIAKHLTLKRA